MDKQELISKTAFLLVKAGFNQKDADLMAKTELDKDEKALELSPEKLMDLCLKNVNKTTYLNKDDSFPGVMTYEKSAAIDKRSKKNKA